MAHMGKWEAGLAQSTALWSELVCFKCVTGLGSHFVVEVLHLCIMKCVGRKQEQNKGRLWGRMEGCLVGRFVVIKGMRQKV